MEKINNLFFCYVILCIGFGVGNVYWNEDLTNYIFVSISSLIMVFLFFSKDFYTNESHQFFWKQLLSISVLSLLCIFVQSEKNIYKIIDLAVSKMFLGAILLWIFSINYHSDKDDKEKRNRRRIDKQGNNMLGRGRYPRPT